MSIEYNVEKQVRALSAMDTLRSFWKNKDLTRNQEKIEGKKI